MILTICLSPCIDVNVEVDSLNVGMSHKIISKRIFFTGKALNVAIGIARLKSSVFATGFMYEINGGQFEQELHREGVPYKFVWNKGRVRENYKFIDRKSMLTEVDDISPEVNAEKQAELIELIKKLSADCEAVVISGGLTKGMTPDYYGKILSAVPVGVKKIVDTEGERLISALKCGVDLAKPNVDELERTLNRKLKNKSDMIAGCNEIISKGAKRVLLSLGKNGAIITDGSTNLYCKSVNVAMNSTLGAGDGMVAAASDALVKGGSLEDILKCGVAAGTAAVTLPDTISFNKNKYDEILSTLTVKEI
ncbi:MAG: hexose kinase [Clostridia bacterium]|jgi:1-phosphofructokinase|nr:hexose kinase [Clostridia bacterium]